MQFGGNRNVWKVLPPIAVASASGSTSKRTARRLDPLRRHAARARHVHVDAGNGSASDHGHPARSAHRRELAARRPRPAGQRQPAPVGVQAHAQRQRRGGDAKPVAIASGRPISTRTAGARPSDRRQSGDRLGHLSRSRQVARRRVRTRANRCRPTGACALDVVLEQIHGGGHLIGRPRVSVTAATNPAAAAPVPASIAGGVGNCPTPIARPRSSVELARFLLGWQARA